MANNNLQSLANQIKWCRDSKNYLIELENNLASVATHYQTATDDMRNKGYLTDLLPQIEQMNREFQELSADLIGHIEQEHLAYIENQSVGIRGALGKIMGN